MSTIEEVYEKYEHLDGPLSDTEWCTSGEGAAMMAWINRQICHFFGHKWSEWHESIGFGDWPTKTRVCHRCGKVHEIDAIEPIACRCWVAYQDPEKLK